MSTGTLQTKAALFELHSLRPHSCVFSIRLSCCSLVPFTRAPRVQRTQQQLAQQDHTNLLLVTVELADIVWQWSRAASRNRSIIRLELEVAEQSQRGFGETSTRKLA